MLAKCIGKFFVLPIVFIFTVTAIQATVFIDNNFGTKKINVIIDDIKITKVILDNKKYSKLELVGVDGYEGIYYQKGPQKFQLFDFLSTQTGKRMFLYFLLRQEG